MTADPSHDSSHQSDSPRASARRFNTQLGLALLLVYIALYGIALYGGFVLLNATNPDLMTGRGIGGMNLAFSLGMVLVVCSIALACVYSWFSRSENVNETIATEMDSVSVRMRNPS